MGRGARIAAWASLTASLAAHAQSGGEPPGGGPSVLHDLPCEIPPFREASFEVPWAGWATLVIDNPRGRISICEVVGKAPGVWVHARPQGTVPWQIRACAEGSELHIGAAQGEASVDLEVELARGTFSLVVVIAGAGVLDVCGSDDSNPLGLHLKPRLGLVMLRNVCLVGSLESSSWDVPGFP